MLNTSKLQDPEGSMPITQVKFKQKIKSISSTKTVVIALCELLDCVPGKNWFPKITLKDPFKELYLK